MRCDHFSLLWEAAGLLFAVVSRRPETEVKCGLQASCTALLRYVLVTYIHGYSADEPTMIILVIKYRVSRSKRNGLISLLMGEHFL